MPVIHTDELSFEKVISEGVTLVDFYADWCGPCKMIAPYLEQAQEELEGKAQIVKIDVDSSPAVAQRFQVMSIPTLILFKDGKVVDQELGFMTKEKIMALINKAL